MGASKSLWTTKLFLFVIAQSHYEIRGLSQIHPWIVRWMDRWIYRFALFIGVWTNTEYGVEPVYILRNISTGYSGLHQDSYHTAHNNAWEVNSPPSQPSLFTNFLCAYSALLKTYSVRISRRASYPGIWAWSICLWHLSQCIVAGGMGMVTRLTASSLGWRMCHDHW